MLPVIDPTKFDPHMELAPQEFVTAMYEDILSTPGDAGGVAFYTAQIAASDGPVQRYGTYLNFVNGIQSTTVSATPPYFEKVLGVLTHQQALWVAIIVILILIIIGVCLTLMFMKKQKEKKENGGEY